MAASVLDDGVQSGLNVVIANHFKSWPKVQVSEGSVAGDGYSSKTCAINLKENGKNLDLFVKYVPKKDYPKETVDLYSKCYSNEHRFYNETFPAMLNFQKERNIQQPFINVINYFPTNIKDGEIAPVFLENIKTLGYQLRDRRKPIDDQHVSLVLTTQAKFHAVSFAMKDQNPELFKKLTTGLGDIFSELFIDLGMGDLVLNAVKELKEYIDPVAEKKLYDNIHNLGNNLVEHCSTLNKQVDEYAVILQGDCWSNNMMFLYDSTTRSPIDMKLLDWQILRLNSPILDIAYSFYSASNKRVLDNFDKYMKLYYNTLSNQIKALGSDPEKLYPENVFKQHWKKLSKVGFAMAFMAVRVLLFNDDEVPNVVESDGKINMRMFGSKITKQDDYIEIMKDLFEHFIDRDFL